MAVKLGVAIVSTDIEEYVRQMRMLDEAGVDMIGCGDSQALYHEQFIRCALAAEHSRRARVGTWITNPITRHPAVTAAGIATVDDIAPGKAFLGVGTGDSTVYSAGLRPAGLSTLERFIHTIRALHQNGSSHWRGQPCHLTWAHRRIPIGMAVSGPRAMRLAGRLADIVWVCFGLQKEEVALAKHYLEEGARDAGRTLEDIDLWWMVQLNIADSRETALEPIKANLATSGHIMFRYGLTRMHRRTALGTALEEARGCSCESGIMVLEQKPARKQGAPNRCCHRTNPTVSASSLTTTAWWPMPG